MCTVEIHDKDIFFPNFPSTKQGHESKRMKTKTFVFMEALNRAVWSVLTMGCFNFFLNFSLEVFFLYDHVVTILFTWLLNSRKACSIRCKSAVTKTRLSRRTSNNALCCFLNVSSTSRRLSRI